MFYRLRKTLYGLKQAPKTWNKRIDGFLKEIWFDKCESEHGVYVKKDTSKWVIILCLYVYTLLIMGINEGYITKFNTNLIKEFEMIGLSLVTYFLGIEFHKFIKVSSCIKGGMHLRYLRSLKLRIVMSSLPLWNQYCSYQKNKDERDIDLMQYTSDWNIAVLVQYEIALGI